MRIIQFVLVFLSTYIAVPDFGQNVYQNKKLPFDPSIRVGKLKNGFTYFIKATNEPTIATQLVVKGGRNQEDLNQVGVSHVVEHMPHNQTRNFKNAMGYFTKHIDTKGEHEINASVDREYTYFRAHIPSDKSDLVSELMRFYRDICNEVVLDSSIIEAEKQAVLEEGRMGQMKEDDLLVRELVFPRLMGKTPFANLQQVDITNATVEIRHDDLKRFYRKWFQPQLQAVIVIGAINIDSTEKMIRELFADLVPGKTKGSVAEENTSFFKWQNRVETIVNEKLVKNRIEIYIKRENKIIKEENDLLNWIKYRLYNELVKARFTYIDRDDDSNSKIILPRYEIGYPVVGPSFDALYASQPFNGDSPMSVLKTLLVEFERIKQHGFTTDELKSAKQIFLASGIFDKLTNKQRGYKLAAYYGKGEAMLDPANTGELIKSMVDAISASVLNRDIDSWFTPKENMDIFLITPDKTITQQFNADRVWKLVKEIQKSAVTPFERTKILDTATVELMSAESIPKLGTMYSTDAFDSTHGIKVLSLNNNIEVLLKRSTEVPGEITLQSVNLNKLAMVKENEVALEKYAAVVVQRSGLGSLSQKSLTKFYKDNSIKYAVPYNYNGQFGYLAKFSNQRLEKLLQVIHLYSMAPKVDPDVLRRTINDAKVDLDVKQTDDEKLLDTLFSYYYNRYISPRSIRAGVDSLNVDDISKYFVNRFSITEGTRFVLMGDFDVDTMLIALQRYIGKIPIKQFPDELRAANKNEKAHDKVNISLTSQEEVGDRTAIRLIYQSMVDSSVTNQVAAEIMEEYLNERLFARLRVEEGGGVYGIFNAASVTLTSSPAIFDWTTAFVCSYNKHQLLIAAVKNEIEKMKTDGIDLPLFDSVKQRNLDKMTASNNTTEFWVGYLLNHPSRKLIKNYNNATAYLEIAKSIKPGDLQKFVSKNFNTDDISSFIVIPKGNK